MLGVGGVGSRGNGAPSVPDVLMPDQVPSCIGWFDASSGVVAPGGEVQSWTDRVGGFSVSSEGAGKIFHDGSRVYCDTYIDNAAVLVGETDLPTGEVTQVVVDLGTVVDGFYVDVFHYESGLETYDANSGNMSTPGLPYTAELVDVLIDGVSIMSDIDTGIYPAPGPISDGDISSVSNAFVSGDLQLVFSAPVLKRLSPYVGTRTMIVSARSGYNTSGQEPIVAFGGGYPFGVAIGVRLEGDVASEHGFGEAADLGKASEVFALRSHAREIDLDLGVGNTDTYILLELVSLTQEGLGFSKTTGLQTVGNFAPGVNGMALFEDGSALFPGNLEIFDIAIFEGLPDDATLAALGRGLLAKRSAA